MDNLQIEDLRNTLKEKLKELRDMTIERNLILHETTPEQKYVEFDDPQLLKKLVFKEINGFYTFALPEDLWKFIDFTNVSFDDVRVEDIDFTRSKGVKLNIQKIANRSLRNAKLSGVIIIGPFNDVDVRGTDFTGCISKDPLIPQVIFGRNLTHTKLNGIEIVGSFSNACINGTDFTKSKGAQINPQILKDKSLKGTTLTDAEIIGSLNGVNIEDADFTGAIMTSENEYNYAKEEINKSFQKVMKNNKVYNN